jgi:cobalt/nickel transport system permease protein
MHIPDGFLSAPVLAVLWLVSLVVIGLALRKNDLSADDRNLPLMGVLAAAIFAAQMLNFPVLGGTSGHLLGAALVAILLGPWRAVLVMTSVVSVQALVFQDGGLIALGGNLFNMAVVGVFSSYAVYSLMKRLAHGGKWGDSLGGFTAAWLSVELGALGVGLQLSLSGTSPANIAVPVMAAIHAIIGIGEGLITMAALALLTATYPGLLQPDAINQSGNRAVVIAGGILSVFLVAISPLASKYPDGLASVAARLGFTTAERSSFYNLLPHYRIPGIENQTSATILAGLLGLVLVGGVAWAMIRVRQSRS